MKKNSYLMKFMMKKGNVIALSNKKKYNPKKVLLCHCYILLIFNNIQYYMYVLFVFF